MDYIHVFMYTLGPVLDLAFLRSCFRFLKATAIVSDTLACLLVWSAGPYYSSCTRISFARFTCAIRKEFERTMRVQGTKKLLLKQTGGRHKTHKQCTFLYNRVVVIWFICLYYCTKLGFRREQITTQVRRLHQLPRRPYRKKLDKRTKIFIMHTCIALRVTHGVKKERKRG